MWLARKIFEQLITSERVEAARSAVLERQNAIQHQHIAWLTNRLNVVEHERALLLDKLGVAVPVPTVMPIAAEKKPDVRVHGAPLRDDINEKPTDIGGLQVYGMDFEDMGDAEASRQNISHDAEGRVRYS